MSKGSKRRPEDKKTYDDNYSQINWGKKETKEKDDGINSKRTR